MTHDKKITWLLINFLISIMAIVLSIVALVRTPKPVIYTVDISEIISKASHALAESHPKGDVPKDVLNRLIQHIKETTQDFGRENNVFILAKQALLSGKSEDLTNIIINKLIQENVFKGESHDVK